MLKNSSNLNGKASSNEVFAYFAIPVEAFQSVAEHQAITNSSGSTSDMIIKTLGDGNVGLINTVEVSTHIAFLIITITSFINIQLLIDAKPSVTSSETTL